MDRGGSGEIGKGQKETGGRGVRQETKRNLEKEVKK